MVFRYSNGRLIARRHGARDKDDAPAETDAALRVADNAGASLVVYVLRRYMRVKVYLRGSQCGCTRAPRLLVQRILMK